MQISKRPIYFRKFWQTDRTVGHRGSSSPSSARVAMRRNADGRRPTHVLRGAGGTVTCACRLAKDEVSCCRRRRHFRCLVVAVVVITVTVDRRPCHSRHPGTPSPLTVHFVIIVTNLPSVRNFFPSSIDRQGGGTLDACSTIGGT